MFTSKDGWRAQTDANLSGGREKGTVGKTGRVNNNDVPCLSLVLRATIFLSSSLLLLLCVSGLQQPDETPSPP